MGERAESSDRERSEGSMTQQYSDDNPYAKLRLVSDPAFGADYRIGLRADTLKQVAISKADCWEEGYHHRDEEVAKLRAENEKLQRILELHCERLWNFGDQRFIKEAEDRVTQEIEDEKQGDGPKDAVL